MVHETTEIVTLTHENAEEIQRLASELDIIMLRREHTARAKETRGLALRDGGAKPGKRAGRGGRGKTRRRPWPRSVGPGSTPSPIRNVTARAWSAITRYEAIWCSICSTLWPVSSRVRSRLCGLVKSGRR